MQVCELVVAAFTQAVARDLEIFIHVFICVFFSLVVFIMSFPFIAVTLEFSLPPPALPYSLYIFRLIFYCHLLLVF